MPTDACQFFFECPSCHNVLRPKAGDCCVYCSYGSVPCPPVKRAKGATHEYCLGPYQPGVAAVPKWAVYLAGVLPFAGWSGSFSPAVWGSTRSRVSSMNWASLG